MATKAPTQLIVLLRGINVGGHAKLPMAQLREICASLGCAEVSTYIQSGNVVLETDMAAATLANLLEKAVDAAVGFTPRVVIRTVADLEAALTANPYPDTPDRYLHVGFMDKAPTHAAVADLDALDVSPEGFSVVGREIYLNYVDGVSQSRKLGKVGFERKLGVAITARNLRTVQKLVALAHR